MSRVLAQSRRHPNAGRGRRNASPTQKKKGATEQESRGKLKAAIEELTRVVTSESGSTYDHVSVHAEWG